MFSFYIEIDGGYGYETCIVCKVNGSDAGYLAVDSCGNIEYIEIFKTKKENYQGLGIYKMLLKKAFEILDFDSLISTNRNDKSNPIYEKWCGAKLEFNDTVIITLQNDLLTLNF